MSNYLVISSDGHAGPPSDVYREYLDPAFRAAFDVHQAEMAALASLGRPDNTAFVEAWDEETGDHDMQSGLRPGGPRPDPRSRGRRRRGPVPRRRRAGNGSARRLAVRVGPRFGGRRRPRQREGGRPGPQPVARRLLRHQPAAPDRRGRGAHHRRRGGRRGRDAGGGAQGSAGDHDPHAVVRGPGLHRPVVRPRLGRVRRGRPRRPHPLGSGSGRLPARARASWPSTPPRRGGGRLARSGCSCCRGCSSATRRSSTPSPRTVRGGSPTSCSA